MLNLCGNIILQMKKIALFSILFIALDLFSKYLVLKYLHSDFEVIRNFFRLSYAENYGIAFSLKVPFYMIFILNFSILFAFYFLIKKELKLDSVYAQIPCAMIIGGGIANLIDRAVNGFVVDFISILTYPTFNIADIFITLGVLFLVVFYAKISRISKIKK